MLFFVGFTGLAYQRNAFQNTLPILFDCRLPPRLQKAFEVPTTDIFLCKGHGIAYTFGVFKMITACRNLVVTMFL